MTLETIQKLEDRYQLRTYAKLPISLERGQGCYVYDQDGTKYLDLYGGHAVASTGHCHPRVVKAIQQQAAELIFYSNVVYSRIRSRAAETLVEMSGPPYHQAFFVNSGSEANENAIKLARAVTGRREVISLEGSFHGRTYGSLSSTGIAKYRSYLNTPVPMHRILPAEETARSISRETAAVLIEPIQSMAGMREIPTDVLTDISRACEEHGALLIFDEIQTGIARTGTFLYGNQLEAKPQMVSLAKGIASGFPAGALLLTRELAQEVKPGDLGTTFGGGPLACAAIQATLEVIAEEKLAENAAGTGTYLEKHLLAMEQIEEVRGRGLLLGLKVVKEKKAKELQEGLREKNILVGSSTDPQVLRLMPPLTLTFQEADLFLGAVKSS